MSSTGVVKVWKRDFGLVEMGDGTMVRIDQSEIKGGTLRAGRSVSFDKDDTPKPKGTNVSGEAVLAEGEKLTEEQEEEDKKLVEEIRKKEDQKLEEIMAEINTKLSKTNRKLLAKELMAKFPVQKTEEKRMDGKSSFTKGEFLAFYGEKEGAKKWKNAPAAKEKKSRKRGDKKKGEEKEAAKEEGEKAEEKKEEKEEEKKEE